MLWYTCHQEALFWRSLVTVFFNPDIHPDRLSRLISAILGQEVTVTAVLSNEDTLLKGNSLLIMDIVVRLADGSITTVEIQKQEAEIQNLYQLTIQLVKKHNGTKEDAEEELIQNCNLSPELVTDLVEKYW